MFLKPTKENFMKVFLSGCEVDLFMYVSDEVIYEMPIFTDKGSKAYIMSPSNKARYDKYLETLKLEKPLLFELR